MLGGPHSAAHPHPEGNQEITVGHRIRRVSKSVSSWLLIELSCLVIVRQKCNPPPHTHPPQTPPVVVKSITSFALSLLLRSALVALDHLQVLFCCLNLTPAPSGSSIPLVLVPTLARCHIMHPSSTVLLAMKCPPNG